MEQFGDRPTFALEVGENVSANLRTVDLWAGGMRLTSDDNVVYLPSFRRMVRESAARVRRREVPLRPFPGLSPAQIFRLLQADETDLREQFWFLRWGETVDNVSAYAFLDGDDLVIGFTFWRETHPDRGEVFVVRMSADAFAASCEQAADLLDAGVRRG